MECNPRKRIANSKALWFTAHPRIRPVRPFAVSTAIVSEQSMLSTQLSEWWKNINEGAAVSLWCTRPVFLCILHN